MDWVGLAINVAALFAGLAVFLVITNTGWGKKHADIQYFIMLVAVIAAVLVGGLLNLLTGRI